MSANRFRLGDSPYDILRKILNVLDSGSGGGGGDYTLPIAGPGSLGGVKVGGGFSVNQATGVPRTIYAIDPTWVSLVDLESQAVPDASTANAFFYKMSGESADRPTLFFWDVDSTDDPIAGRIVRMDAVEPWMSSPTDPGRWVAVSNNPVSDYEDHELHGFVASEVGIVGATDATADHNGKWINADSGSDFNYTIDATDPIPDGFSVAIYQAGAGAVSVVGAGGATILNRQSHTKTAGQYAVVTVKRIGGTNNYVLIGDTAA